MTTATENMIHMARDGLICFLDNCQIKLIRSSRVITLTERMEKVFKAFLFKVRKYTF